MKKIIKKIFGALLVLGFVLVLGTAGISDLEAETHQQFITDKQFYTQTAVGLCLLSIGGIGTLVISNRQSNERVKQRGMVRLQEVPNHGAIRDTYYTRTETTHENSQKRSAS